MTAPRGTVGNAGRSPTDWIEITRRLDSARVALERSGQITDKQIAHRLEVRARALAAKPAPPVTGQIEVLEFALAAERYAIEPRHIREVCVLQALTPVPCTPAFVAGIVQLRGEILSVVDLRKFFGLPAAGLSDLNKAIVLESASMRFAILADSVPIMRQISPATLKPSDAALGLPATNCVIGVTGDRVVLLDGARLLADARIVVRQDTLA